MATASVTLPATKEETRPCPCGCAPCDEECCQLDCLVRPRFFYGQLLTDQDLKAMLTWTRYRLQLSRYRDGWGVVCGLDVRCDPERPGHVLVGPGYAVDCCGKDIVVCAESSKDLRDACRLPEDPCEDVLVREVEEPRVETGRRRIIESVVVEEKPGLGSMANATGDLYAVDLFIRHQEKQANPQTALTGDACGDVRECEPSRIHEGHELHWHISDNSDDPRTIAANEWHTGYGECLDMVQQFRIKYANLYGNGKYIKRWLLSWIETHPLSLYCYLYEEICAADDEAFEDESFVAYALYLLVQDCRNAYLACDCHHCQGDTGVRLARVYMQQGEDRQCHIIGVDPYSPYRRPLQHDCWPAPPGKVNLGQVIWHRADEACLTLADMGVQVAGVESLRLPATVDELIQTLDCSLFLSCNEPVIMQTLRSRLFGERVIGFCGATSEGRSHITVEKTADRNEAAPGDIVQYKASITNDGEVLVRLFNIYDSLRKDAPFNLRLGLLPGESKTYEYTMTVPHEHIVELENEFVASGSDEYGRPVHGSATHTLKVVHRESPVRKVEVYHDYKVITGIGQVYEKRLHELNYRTYNDLAREDVEKLQQNFPSIKRETLANWIEEAAREAAKGE